jgi:hypothetical protein
MYINPGSSSSIMECILALVVDMANETLVWDGFGLAMSKEEWLLPTVAMVKAISIAKRNGANVATLSIPQ